MGGPDGHAEMTDTPRLWDRRADETPKSYAAFLAYVALGARRSVREAARQHCVKTASSGPKNTTVKHWLRWSARHKWVSRSLARDEWIARTSDDQIVSNVTACKLALTTRAHDFLTANDGPDASRPGQHQPSSAPPGVNSGITPPTGSLPLGFIPAGRLRTLLPPPFRLNGRPERREHDADLAGDVSPANRSPSRLPRDRALRAGEHQPIFFRWTLASRPLMAGRSI